MSVHDNTLLCEIRKEWPFIISHLFLQRFSQQIYPLFENPLLYSKSPFNTICVNKMV